MTERPIDMTVMGPSLFAFNLCKTLIEKQMLTQAEASKVMIDTAESLRTATDGEVDQPAGEAHARMYEQYAAWLQGYSGNLPTG